MDACLLSEDAEWLDLRQIRRFAKGKVLQPILSISALPPLRCPVILLEPARNPPGTQVLYSTVPFGGQAK